MQAAPRIRVVVDNRLRLDLAEATAVLGVDGVHLLKQAFSHPNPTHAKIRAMGYWPPASEPPVIETWRVEGSELTLPRGGTDRVRAAAERVGAAVSWRDRRVAGRDLGPIPPHGLALWEHQSRAYDVIVARENCLARTATAGGKTTLAIALASRLGLATIVIVWSKHLLDQWVKRCKKELGDDFDVGVVRGRVRKLRPITIAMQQTLARRGVDEELRQTFGCVVFDEVQRAGAPSAFAVLDAFPARYRVGVSDDERRLDSREGLVYDLLGKVAVEVDSAELEAKGLVMPVEVRAVPTRFRADWLDAEAAFTAVEMRSGDPGADANRLLAEMAADEGRDALIRRLVADEVADGAQVLVLSRRRQHASDLRDRLIVDGVPGVAEATLVGSKGSAAKKCEFEAVLDAIAAGSARVAVGTVQAVGVGQDIPTIEAGVLALPIGYRKPQFFRQLRGRLARRPAGKRRARFYVLVDEHVFGTGVLRTLERWNHGSVVVLDDGAGRLDGSDAWVPVSEYLRARRARRSCP